MRAFMLVLLMSGVAAAVEPKFEPQTIDDKIQIGYGLAIGDVDGDGKPDILLADAKQIVWYANPGAPGKPWAKHVMAENLTEHDNVCIAARDIDGSGKVSVAVGAQWNPGETGDEKKSGAIFYLIRPADPTQKWEPVRIEPHDPTTHRMQWVKVAEKKFVLAVLPLHGKGNKDGEGTPVRMQFITPPENRSDPKAEWKSEFVDTSLHLAHNFTIVKFWQDPDVCYLQAVGREGIHGVHRTEGSWATEDGRYFGLIGQDPAGEVATSSTSEWTLLAVIQPMHGNRVAAHVEHFYREKKLSLAASIVIDQDLKEGHALQVADLLGLQRPQVVAGWRAPNLEGKVGIRLYSFDDERGKKWTTYLIDDNKMACEDLKVADLDGDGKLDIIASGRATHNVVVYWNRSEVKK